MRGNRLTGDLLRRREGSGSGSSNLRDDPWAPLKIAAFVVAAGFLDGWVGVLVGVVVGVEVLGGKARRLLVLAAGCLVAALAWNIIRGLPSSATVSALWVLDNRVSHHLAFAGIAFLTAGLISGSAAGNREPP